MGNRVVGGRAVVGEQRSAPDAPAAVSHDIEVLFAEARRRARRRRAIVVASIILTVVGVVVLLATSIPRPAALATPDAASLPPRAAASSIPPVYVAHVQQTTGSPGDIVVVDSTSGKITRTLGAEFDPYLKNGFQLSPDGSMLFYTRLNEPAQTTEIVAQPTAGGAGRVIVADGTNPLVSPDGTHLVFRPGADPGALSVLNLSDGTLIDTRLPAGYVFLPNHAQTVQVAWMPGSTGLYIAVDDLPYAPDCMQGYTCVPSTVDLVPPVAYILDIAGAPAWVARPPQPDSTVQGGRFSLLGPGFEPNAVLAVQTTTLTDGSPGPERLESIDVETGRVRMLATVPDDGSIISRDSLGQNFVLSTAGGLAAWSPASGAVARLPVSAEEVAW